MRQHVVGTPVEFDHQTRGRSVPFKRRNEGSRGHTSKAEDPGDGLLVDRHVERISHQHVIEWRRLVVLKHGKHVAKAREVPMSRFLLEPGARNGGSTPGAIMCASPYLYRLTLAASSETGRNDTSSKPTRAASM